MEENESFEKLDNEKLSKIPPIMKLMLASILPILVIGIGGLSSIFVSATLDWPILNGIIFSFFASSLLALFVLWAAITTTNTARWIYLTQDKLIFEKNNGKKYDIIHSKIIGFGDASKLDEKSSEPAWIVLYYGKSMFTAKNLLLSRDNAIKIKEHLDSLGVHYQINP